MSDKAMEIIRLSEKLGAPNYKPLPVVISRGEGCWLEDVEGNKYLDMLSAYSAVNQGHRHPKIIEALKKQADNITLTSRAFHHDQLAAWYEKIAALTNKNMVLPMNTGVEAVETALKVARRWGYSVKGIQDNQAEIIVCANNFHGRTIGAISLSSEEAYKEKFGPLVTGIKIVPYGDASALEAAISPNTAAFLVEPIQGEAGIVIPPEGYLHTVRQICESNNVLFIADEIQTGLGRTGKMFASEWENVIPDMYILGKALGGGVFPISCVAADSSILSLMTNGSHGSTFGGNPLACAVSIAAVDVLVDENLIQQSFHLGEYFLEQLQLIQSSIIKEVRGKGLFVGMELYCAARPICEKLKEKGLLCKETHDNVIRFAPPLTIDRKTLDWALEHIRKVLLST